MTGASLGDRQRHFTPRRRGQDGGAEDGLNSTGLQGRAEEIVEIAEVEWSKKKKKKKKKKKEKNRKK